MKIIIDGKPHDPKDDERKIEAWEGDTRMSMAFLSPPVSLVID